MDITSHDDAKKSLTFSQAAEQLMLHCSQIETESMSKFVLTTGMSSLEAVFDVPGFQPTMVRQMLAVQAMRMIMEQDELEFLDAASARRLCDKVRKSLTGLAPSPARQGSIQ